MSSGAFSSSFRRKFLAAVASLAALSGASPATCRAEETFVSLGTGEMNGVYYPVGSAICATIEHDLRAMNIRCSPETTPGSVYNVDAVRTGELEFGIVQSDVQFAAYKGIGAWSGRPVSSLRSVLSVYPEYVTVIARAGANIHVAKQLAGKRVNVGSQGTGTRTTWNAIAAELARNDVVPSVLTELKASDTTTALCDGTIDANLLIVGHPSPLVAHQLSACPSNLVAFREAFVDSLIETRPYYVRSAIPGQLYGIPDETPTFDTRATIVTSSSTDGRVVAAMTRAIFAHIAALRTLHPALSGLKDSEMVSQGLTAPLHPAAAAVYKELGLIN